MEILEGDRDKKGTDCKRGGGNVTGGKKMDDGDVIDG